MTAVRQLRARVLLAEAAALGVDLADLVAVGPAAPRPTLAVVLAAVEPTFTRSTAATYRPYWRLALDRHGDRAIDTITPAELQVVVDAAAERARSRRPASTGWASRETTVAALRALFARAAAAGLAATNPAASLRKPHRAASRRRALDDAEQVALVDAVRTTSPDPDLDLLLLRFHLETAARRQGALGLRHHDLDLQRATVWLREKHDAEREQPVSPTLVRLLHAHHVSRATDVDGSLFRRRDGAPMSSRHYDRLYGRARSVLGWGDRPPVSTHVLRHTAITAIGRIAGYPVAQAFAGHAPPTVTGRYLHATLAEVATAVAVMTGERHPLAPAEASPGRCRRG